MIFCLTIIKSASKMDTLKIKKVKIMSDKLQREMEVQEKMALLASKNETVVIGAVDEDGDIYNYVGRLENPYDDEFIIYIKGCTGKEILVKNVLGLATLNIVWERHSAKQCQI